MIKTRRRVCPICSQKDAADLGKMSIKTLLSSNPGYNKEWFERHDCLLNTHFPFVLCNKCGFVYSQHILADDLLYDYYNHGINASFSQSKIYKSAKRTQLISIWQNLYSISQLDGPIKVLDFGAGWGDFLAIAKAHGIEVYGLEFDERKIDFAQRNGIPCGDFKFIEKNAPYDIFMCNQVLEHLDKPKEALVQLRSLLKDEAIGFVSVPNFPIDVVFEQIQLIKNGKLPSKDFDPLGHLNYFDHNSLQKILKESGFEIVKRTSQKSIKGVISMLRKRIKRSKYQPQPSFYVKAV